jgi:hypothetical protein
MSGRAVFDRGGRVIENLTRSNSDERREWVKQSWEVTAILKEIGDCIFVMAMSGAGRK